MPTEALKQELIRDLRQVIGMFESDLAALTPEQRATPPGQAQRSPLDFVHEIAIVNGRLAARMRGEDPGPFPQGWVTVPEGMAEAAVIEGFRAACAELVAAAEALPAERWGDTPPGLKAEDGSYVGIVTFAALHMGYHDGQMNLIQSMAGDQAVHWKM